MNYKYWLFNSISLVMLAARRIEKKGLPCKVVPIPREFSSDCGVCIRTDVMDEAGVRSLLSGAGLAVSSAYTGKAL